MKEPVEFDRWVNDHNPAPSLSYGKGWWDHVETVRRLAEKIRAERVSVSATYRMTTPPPQETLLMPVTRLRAGGCVFWLKEDFGASQPYWVLAASLPQAPPPACAEGFLLDRAPGEREMLGFDDFWAAPAVQGGGRFVGLVGDEWNLYGAVRRLLVCSRPGT